MITYTTLMSYITVLSLICIAAPFAARRAMANRLRGTFGEDIDLVLKRAGIGAMISGAIVFFSMVRLPVDAHISVAARAWSSLPSMVQWHITCAVIALLAGPVVLIRKKGDRLHKLVGRVWVVSMYGLALTGIPMWLAHRSGGPLILFSAITLVSLTIALRAAFKGDIRTHLRFMIGSYIGLLTALVFSMLPGRVVANWVISLFV